MKWQLICEPRNEKASKFITKVLKDQFQKKGWGEFEEFEVDFQTSTPEYDVYVRCRSEHNELIEKIKETVKRYLISHPQYPQIKEIKNPSKFKQALEKLIPLHPYKKSFFKEN